MLTEDAIEAYEPHLHNELAILQEVLDLQALLSEELQPACLQDDAGPQLPHDDHSIPGMPVR